MSLPFIKPLIISNDKIRTLEYLYSEDYSILTKDNISGFIKFRKTSFYLIFKTLDLFSAENKKLSNDIKRIIFQKLLVSILESQPQGIHFKPLYETLIFSHIDQSEIDKLPQEEKDFINGL